MKRSKTIQLLLISSSPFYLTACDQHQYRLKSIEEVKSYKNVQDCLDDNQNPVICSKANALADQLAQQNPIIYPDRASCQQDFDNELCLNDPNTPSQVSVRSSGFQFTTHRNIVMDKDDNVIDPDKDNYARSVAERQTQYQVQPLYKPRAGRNPTHLVNIDNTDSSLNSAEHSSSPHMAGAVASGALMGYMANKAINNNAQQSFMASARNPIQLHGNPDNNQNAKNTEANRNSKSSQSRKGLSSSRYRSFGG